MHRDVSLVSLAKSALTQLENCVQIFTSYPPMMDQQNQVTLTNWPASKKKTDNSKKGIETQLLLRLSNDDFFLEIKRFCHIVFSMFLLVVFFPIKTGMIFCLDAVAQRLLEIL